MKAGFYSENGNWLFRKVKQRTSVSACTGNPRLLNSVKAPVHITAGTKHSMYMMQTIVEQIVGIDEMSSFAFNHNVCDSVIKCPVMPTFFVRGFLSRRFLKLLNRNKIKYY